MIDILQRFIFYPAAFWLLDNLLYLQPPHGLARFGKKQKQTLG